MTTRRKFFNRIASVIAAVALAPEIAFRAPLNFGWKSTSLGIYAEMQNLPISPGYELNLPDIFRQLYAIKHSREASADKGGSWLI